jgi:uncharacterized protein (DUF1015 family)
MKQDFYEIARQIDEPKAGLIAHALIEWYYNGRWEMHEELKHRWQEPCQECDGGNLTKSCDACSGKGVCECFPDMHCSEKK